MSFKILMFPWLAHGHIFPFLELAKRILQKRKFHIYLCSTPINFPSINHFISTNSLQNSIEIIQLHLEPNPQLPPHLHTTKTLNLSLLKAFQTSKSSFSHILTHLHPDLLIYDIFQPWAPPLAASLDIPAVHFVIFGAATTSFIHHNYVIRRDEAFPFPELCLGESERKSLDDLVDFAYANVFDYDKDTTFFVNFRLSTEVVLLKACRALEGKYVDYVSSACVPQKRILAVGPLVSDHLDHAMEAAEKSSDIMQWLNKNPKNSTVFICFGSECLLSEREIAEVAKGLELSESNFVWAVEGAVALPEGFVERVGERGRVVHGWVPQKEILGHPSVGAFVSHCGWSSLNESVYEGVPVVEMPMRLNMFVDAKMLVSEGVCVEVGRGEGGWFEGEEIGRVIGEVMGGEEMRSRAREMSEKMREEEEGRDEIGEVAELLWQMCSKTN